MGAEGIPIRDIHLPEPISWWPPALGWWLLLAVIVGLMGLVFYLRYQKRLTRYRNAALAQLGVLMHYYQDLGDAQAVVRELSILLRAISMHHYNAEQIASLSGEDWLRFLDQQLPADSVARGDCFMQKGGLLLTAPYQAAAHITEDQVRQLLFLAKKWMKRLPLLPVPVVSFGSAERELV